MPVRPRSGDLSLEERRDRAACRAWPGSQGWKLRSMLVVRISGNLFLRSGDHRNRLVLVGPYPSSSSISRRSKKIAAALDDGGKDPYLAEDCDAFAHPPMQRTNTMIPEWLKSAVFLAAHIAALATVALLISYGNNI